jgi:hypothetical protein
MSAVEPAIARNPADAGDARRRLLWVSLAVFVVLTPILFWRYAFFAATTVSDPGDPLFLTWTMEWVERALVHNPSDLFDAPMFHPFTGTLAYSDPLITQSILALPLRALGLGPLAAYNAVYICGIIAAGVLTALLFFELTGDAIAAMVGAVVATFPSIRLFHLAHLQLQVTTFWPLVLLLVSRVFEKPSLGRASMLTIALVATALASLYYGMFMGLLLPPFVIVLWLCLPGRSAKALAAVCAAGAASAVALVPFARIYQRAIAHLALERANRSFSALSDYLGVSPVSDLGRLFPSLIVDHASPQWVGGGVALILPFAGVATLVAALRASKYGRWRPFPNWARAFAPYAVLGCLALFLSLGPHLRWKGPVTSERPFGSLSGLPGLRDIRDFQRGGFVVAIAGGALIALALAEIARRRHPRLRAGALAFVGLTTLIPVLSTSLPAYRPIPPADLAPVYRWVEQQPEPLVIFEVPLPRRVENETFDYLWAAIQHKKRMVHGFSGYMPLTDLTLREESTRIHRPDFFRALSMLGATHLVVHTAAMNHVVGGAVSLARLREARGADRVAQFEDAEVYRIEAVRTDGVRVPERLSEKPASASGGWMDPSRDCVEFGPSTAPLVYYAPRSSRIEGLKFLAETPLGESDDALLVELSSDLSSWRAAPHRPLLSTALSAYVERPTPDVWVYASFPQDPGPFVRLTSQRDQRLRFCNVQIESNAVAPIEAVAEGELHAQSNVGRDTAALTDGNPETRWHTGRPQLGGEWIDVDLGRARTVSAVVLDLGSAAYDYGRRLQVDCGSVIDALEPGPAIDGDQVLFTRPAHRQVLPVAPPKTCRFLRIRQVANAPDNYWSVGEIAVIQRIDERIRATR